MSELDNFGTAGAKSADRAIGHFSRAMLTYIILTKSFVRAIGSESVQCRNATSVQQLTA
ncbi:MULTISPECIES: hypothetical protein [unclassified Microcoleus]|uniref:hypothetical protein n=1 Tax=unclassified Microcoleus TaxID=2642155 RepID=UPI001E09D329|nr:MULTISPECIES: hypothetical protein [unclassified Microcoleus]MCC3445536.1 hypothetical protein [Microcoleus sp. PH2017_03_ELD_O_A]MCC3468790.1 hypothetical protein [Microcoleus sp. PH2017_06_SFM_O_A]MCC3507515.1 hypothetical protein [Microcoleus sp. PH2017_19_SFW_U_A]MCC3511165.1 hypothetical protein [Microcoleus sp. PH2017_17_BER_D_A]MCC3548726.1 hypothetical protein [Microcoleus sp. PH2017_24_DOB_U_A]MCC3557501.1 hypothetical protein [Microcoleus sp. PH2017_35_SFW_U_B]MCC3563828.1 hypot